MLNQLSGEQQLPHPAGHRIPGIPCARNIHGNVLLEQPWAFRAGLGFLGGSDVAFPGFGVPKGTSAIPLGLGSVMGCPSMIRICFFWVETPENTNSGKALAGSGVGKE